MAGGRGSRVPEGCFFGSSQQQRGDSRQSFGKATPVLPVGITKEESVFGETGARQPDPSAPHHRLCLWAWPGPALS